MPLALVTLIAGVAPSHLKRPPFYKLAGLALTLHAGLGSVYLAGAAGAIGAVALAVEMARRT